jgi:hypothetical protein
MSSRLDPAWSVLASYQTFETDRCVDVFSRPDGSFGFEEFRRGPEDRGVWTPISYYAVKSFATESDAIFSARESVTWLDALLRAQR